MGVYDAGSPEARSAHRRFLRWSLGALAVAIAGLATVGLIYLASCRDPGNPGGCLLFYLAASLLMPFGILLISVWAWGYLSWSGGLKRLGRRRPWYELPAVLLFGVIVGYTLLLSGCAVIFH